VKAENNVEGEDADGQGGLGRGAGGSGRGRGNRFRGGREDWGMRNQDVSTRDFVCVLCVCSLSRFGSLVQIGSILECPFINMAKFVVFCVPFWFKNC